MRFASAVTTNPNNQEAVDDLLRGIDTQLTRGMVDLALWFLTAHFNDELSCILDRLGTVFPAAVLVGCTAEGTLGCNDELQRGPSMALLAASLPGVSINPFRLRQRQLEHADESLDWERLVGVAPESHPTFLAFGDPFHFAVHEFVDRINHAFPGAALVGGVASAGRQPLQNRLFINDEIERDGAVGVALTGRLTVSTVVSQGCRPIGTPFVITKGERNVIRELGGRVALEQLQNVLVGLSRDDEQLARQWLLIGRVINEYKDRFTRGDFLIHNIVGVDRKSGAIGIAGHARVGATVQFHVRDAQSADEDLREMLAPHGGTGVCGAAMFGCNGRGTRMWSDPGHDLGVFHELLGEAPIAGFFCGGEFGPIGGRNFVHSLTASMVLFREPKEEPPQEPPAQPA